MGATQGRHYCSRARLSRFGAQPIHSIFHKIWEALRLIENIRSASRCDRPVASHRVNDRAEKETQACCHPAQCSLRDQQLGHHG